MINMLILIKGILVFTINHISFHGILIKHECHCVPSLHQQAHSMFHLILHKVPWYPYGILIFPAQAVLSGQRHYLEQPQSTVQRHTVSRRS